MSSVSISQIFSKFFLFFETETQSFSKLKIERTGSLNRPNNRGNTIYFPIDKASETNENYQQTDPPTRKEQNNN